jgi:hypothetical protein
MSVGIVVPLPAYTLDPAFIAKKAEDLGFESIWYHEHPILPVDSASPFPATGGEIPWTYRHFSEPYISLAMAAAVTSKIKGSVANLVQGAMKGQLARSVWGLSSQGVEQFGRSEALVSSLTHHLFFLDHVHEVDPN